MIIVGILALLATIGIHYICTYVSGAAFSNSFFSVLIFGALFFLWKKTVEEIRSLEDKKERKKRLSYAEAGSFLFGLAMVMGYQIKINGMTECGFKGKGMILVWALCLSLAVFPAAYALFTGAGTIPLHTGIKFQESGWSGGKVFLVCWAVIFLCWIPVFLAYYPAVMAYDFHRQSREATFGPPYFNSHHPLAHTWLIWLFFQIGELFGSLETGMAFYSIFQMLILSAALAYACSMIYRLCRKKAALMGAAAFFAVFPYHSVLAVSVTKDVIFAALFLVFFLLLIERMYFSHNKNLLDAVIFIDGCLMLIFRNNAIYAFAVFAIFFVWMTGSKERLRVLALCVLIIAAGKGALEGMQAVMGGLGRGSDVEKYSVVIQQFARVGHYHRGELEPELYELLNTYVPQEYWDEYNPPISDSVKVHVPFDVWEEDMAAMWKAWAKIGMEYPNEYLDAFLCLTCGYWFPDDVTWAENLGYGPEERKGALFTFNSTVSDAIPEGIAHESKFPWLEGMLEEIVSNNCFYRWPVASNLFKPAFYCWVMAFCILSYLYLKRKRALMLSMFPLIYLGTLLLGPVVIVRYMYAILLTVPVLLALLFAQDTQEREKTEMRKI